MRVLGLEKYCIRAIKGVATHAKQIRLSSVVIAPWVRLKCQFGCVHYGMQYCCPPDTPTPEKTREILDSYYRAISFHIEHDGHIEHIKHIQGGKTLNRRAIERPVDFYEMLIDLEGEMFKDGYYKAFVLLAGYCHLCKECAKIRGVPCRYRRRDRPSMEACGIDVYQTARNNGFFIKPLREKTEGKNVYCLMLVD
jgi:predicted metal-binding protein